MKVLLIENEPAVVEKLCEQLRLLAPHFEVDVAMSRSSGISAITCGEFDFIICDLRIPTRDGEVNDSEDHGLAVFYKAKELCPGTPCLFFTGFATSQRVLDELSSGEVHDIFGTGKPYEMTRLLTKDNFLLCLERLEEFASELEKLGVIHIKFHGGTKELDKMEERALRILARPLEGTGVEAEELTGLSGARTLRARVRNNKGQVVASQFVKISKGAKLKEEKENYERHVGTLLGVGRFPALGRHLNAGIGKREALFYQLADEYPESLFGVLSESDCDATAVVESLQDTFGPWQALSEERLLGLAELLEQHIDARDLSRILNELGPMEALKEVKQKVRMSRQHGDLHGFNVLCGASGEAVVVDFGNVGVAPACLDPVVLELSLVFHRGSPIRNSSWPTMEQSEIWFDIDEYVRGCPFPKFVKKCREWASETGGTTGLPLVVCAEALRQLKYKDTDHDRAIAIARAAKRHFS